MTTFDYQRPTEEQTARIEAVRAGFNALLEVVQANCKPSRCTSLVLTKLEEACMWATKGIVFENADK